MQINKTGFQFKANNDGSFDGADMSSEGGDICSAGGAITTPPPLHYPSSVPMRMGNEGGKDWIQIEGTASGGSPASRSEGLIFAILPALHFWSVSPIHF